VTASGDETRTQLEYLDEIRAQATNLSRSGESIRDLMPRIREVDREEFTTVFDNVAADIDVAQAFVANEPPTRSLIPVWALYRQTVEAWDSGASLLAEAVLQAADDPDDAVVVNSIGDALADLRAGDNLFRDLRVEFEREEIPDPVSPLVDVHLAPAEGGLLSLSASYVAAARASTNGLGLRPGLQVSQVVTDPSWQINVDGQPVVPASETIAFSVVVTNSGNVESTPETLAMTLTGGVEPILAQVEVPALNPDGQATIEFAPVAVEPAVLYEILIELIVNGLDSDLTDNSLRAQFTVNES
jgi:hypothetical protein